MTKPNLDPHRHDPSPRMRQPSELEILRARIVELEAVAKSAELREIGLNSRSIMLGHIEEELGLTCGSLIQRIRALNMKS